MRTLCRLLVLSTALLLAGCKVDLYSNLSEVDANQMLALLASNQVKGSKEADKSGGLVLKVEEDDFVKAVEVLRQNGFPKRAYRFVDELFPSGQLVSSPAQEQAKIQFLREQSLERMLSNIEGVISANVVIADGADEDSRKEGSEPSASVLVKHSPEVNLRALSAQLKNLVRNSLPGVKQDRISLILQEVNYRFSSTGSAQANASMTPAPVVEKTQTPVVPAQPAPAAAAVETPVPAAASAEKSETATTPVKAKFAENPEVKPGKAAFASVLPGWPYFVLFWVLCCGGIVWHGKRKNRKQSACGVAGHAE